MSRSEVNSATTAVADAYVWGLPLVTVHRTRSRARAEGLVALTALATPADRAVVAPNNDTLYASGWFDLAAGDVVVDVGPMDHPGRYWSVMLLDAVTNVAYVCRRLHGTDGASVRVVLDPAAGPAADEARPVVAMGGRTLWVIVRVLVDGPEDLAAAADALARIAVGHPAGPAPGPPRLPSSPRGSRGFFADLRAALVVDPPAPWHPPAPPGVEDLADLPADLLDAGVAEGRMRLDARGGGADRHRNGWGTRVQGAAFGDDVEYRAAFARVSLAGHLPAENRSYSRPVDGAEPATLRFPPGGLPPVHGFWSLTMYGRDLFLVDNELDRYSLGDRTPGLRPDADGGLTVVVAHRRPAATANWLPAPPDRGFLVLRCYEGGPEVVAADWFPPPLDPGGDA
jgi:hypothetical protein